MEIAGRVANNSEWLSEAPCHGSPEKSKFQLMVQLEQNGICNLKVSVLYLFVPVSPVYDPRLLQRQITVKATIYFSRTNASMKLGFCLLFEGHRHTKVCRNFNNRIAYAKSHGSKQDVRLYLGWMGIIIQGINNSWAVRNQILS